MIKLGGWVRDSEQPCNDVQHADHKFSALQPTLSLSETPVAGVVDLRRFCSPIEQQAQLGSCVGNSVVGGLEFLQIKQGKTPFVDLSRLFVYYNARLMTQDQDKDNGTYIRLAMGTLSSLGTCSEAKWPYDVTKVFIRPSWSSYREGYANKIDAYYKIDATGADRIETIKAALQAQHPVVFGMIVDQDYMDVGSDGMVAMPKPVRVNSGGHAQLIVGYNDNTRRFIVRNSWGVYWGDNGYGYVPYDYLDASDADDFWVPTLLNP